MAIVSLDPEKLMAFELKREQAKLREYALLRSDEEVGTTELIGNPKYLNEWPAEDDVLLYALFLKCSSLGLAPNTRVAGSNAFERVKTICCHLNKIIAEEKPLQGAIPYSESDVGSRLTNLTNSADFQDSYALSIKRTYNYVEDRLQGKDKKDSRSYGVYEGIREQRMRHACWGGELYYRREDS